MVFAAGIDYRYVAGVFLASVPALYFLLAFSDYRRRRVLAFLDPWADPLGDGFQMIQSMIAVGTGGIFGRGLMARRAEAVLPARTAQRFHLRGDLGGARVSSARRSSSRASA